MAVRSLNAIPGDPNWCGHLMVSMRTWTCAKCFRPVPDEARRAILAAPTRAMPGHVWVLSSGVQSDTPHDHKDAGGCVEGVYSDRARIPHIMVRGRIVGAAELRERMARIHWYTSVFNPDVLEGWDEEPADDDSLRSFYLTQYRIDGE